MSKIKEKIKNAKAKALEIRNKAINFCKDNKETIIVGIVASMAAIGVAKLAYDENNQAPNYYLINVYDDGTVHKETIVLKTPEYRVTGTFNDDHDLTGPPIYVKGLDKKELEKADDLIEENA